MADTMAMTCWRGSWCLCAWVQMCVCVRKLLFYTVYFDCAGGDRDHCKPGTNKDACFDLWYQKGTPFWRTCNSVWTTCFSSCAVFSIAVGQRFEPADCTTCPHPVWRRLRKSGDGKFYIHRHQTNLSSVLGWTHWLVSTVGLLRADQDYGHRPLRCIVDCSFGTIWIRHSWFVNYSDYSPLGDKGMTICHQRYGLVPGGRISPKRDAD